VFVWEYVWVCVCVCGWERDRVREVFVCMGGRGGGEKRVTPRQLEKLSGNKKELDQQTPDFYDNL